LITERPESFLKNLDSFLAFCNKKKYKCSLGKLLRRKAKKNEDSLDNQNRTFFCSELVAAAYKHIELIDPE